MLCYVIYLFIYFNGGSEIKGKEKNKALIKVTALVGFFQIP